MIDKKDIISKINDADKIGKKDPKKSLQIANRVEERWGGNGGNGHSVPMQSINISLSSKGEEKKKLVIKLKASKISDEILTDLPGLVKKFF